MWFHKFKYKIYLRIYLKLRSIFINKIDPLYDFIQLTNLLKPEVFSLNSNQNNFYIVSKGNSVDDLISLLELINLSLQNETKLPNLVFSTENIRINLLDFFTDKNRSYIDQSFSIDKLKIQLTQYLIFIKQNKDKAKNIITHNLLMLEDTSNTLHKLTLDLIIYSSQ